MPVAIRHRLTRDSAGLGAIARRVRVLALTVAVCSLQGLALRPAYAQTLPQALVRAYQTNPYLNAERARLRATDENVPQALSGYRPQVVLDLSAGLQGVRNLLPGGETQSATLKPWSAGLTVKQNIFNGLRTANTVRQAEAQVEAGRATLRSIEQSVLLDVVAAYMNVIANGSLVEAQRSNVEFLRETLTIARRRLDAGDATPTDVAQAEARLNRGVADLNNAEVNLAVSQGTYLQVVGSTPGRLAPADPIDRLLPKQRNDALALARRDHPSIIAATFAVDASQRAVNIAEGQRMPNVNVVAGVSRGVDNDPTLGVSRSTQASIVGQATVPVYDGGLVASQVRQAKEVLAQTRNELDRIRAQAETAVAAAWVTNEGTRVSLSAAESEVKAAALALEGVRREQQAGQRTILEVLNSQQDLISARARLIQAQRDRVIASYTLLSAIGRLDHARLGLATPDYDPTVHYHQVRDAWDGMRIPSGR